MTESTQTQLQLSNQLIKRFQQAECVVEFNPYNEKKVASLKVIYSNGWEYVFRVEYKHGWEYEPEIWIPSSKNSATVHIGEEFIPEGLMPLYEKLKSLVVFTEEDHLEILEARKKAREAFDKFYRVVW